MADEMKGIDKLRKLAGDMNQTPLWMSLRLDREGDYGGRSNAIRLTKTLNDLADQIEREHAEETAASKRDLADEAREAVERLRAVSHDDILRSANPDFEIVREIGNAVGASWIPTYTSKFDAISDRIIELIEHGGKRGADVAALRELADDLESLEVSASSAEFASGYEDGCEYAAERIRKAVEGAPDRGNIVSRCRPCRTEREAAADWVAAQGGLSVVHDYPKMDEFVASLANELEVSDDVGCGDDLRDAVKGELDKRLMPLGMEWPRWDDGKQVSHYDTLEDATAICLALDGSCYSLHYDMSDGERLCLFDGSERIKRPEPEVRGADGLPIKVGETVYTPAGTKMTVRNITGDMVSAGIPTSDRAHAHMLARFLTHTTPDTNERIDKDASMPPRRYYADKIGHDVGLKDDEEVFAAVALDLLRRQRELDAKTMGGDAE